MMPNVTSEVADPYTFIASTLQAGEVTRARLKEITGLDYSAIEAALYRFIEVTDSVETRTDGAGIEHYSWKLNAPSPSVSAMIDPNNEEQDVTATSVGIAVTQNVRKHVESLPDGAEVSVTSIYEWFLETFPAAKQITRPTSFKMTISTALRSLDGGPLTLAKIKRNNANIYIKEAHGYDVKCVCCGKVLSEGAVSDRCGQCKEKTVAPVQSSGNGHGALPEPIARALKQPPTIAPVVIDIPDYVRRAIRGARIELLYQQLHGEESPMSDTVISDLDQSEGWLVAQNAYYLSEPSS